MTQRMQAFPTVLVAILSATIVFTQTAIAQDPAMQAAQAAAQANQMAMQAAQQANDQAMAAAQAANAQAMAAAQAASDDTGPIGQIPRQRPVPVPLAPDAPVPAQIAAAHSVFLSNSGADANFPVDETKAFNDVYAALQSWGHYQFVTSPAQADLIFDLHDIAPLTDVTGGRGGVYSISSPAFQLVIVDAKTNITLWTVTSPVDIAGRSKARAQWYSLAVTNLVSRVKVLAGQPLSAAESADLTTVPKSHYGRNVAIIVGASAVVGVGMLLIARHALSSMKNSQDAFCTAHNIPLSECAGG